MSSRFLTNICFHGIGASQRNLDENEAIYWVDKDRFLRILDDLVERNDVRISFDDGNASDIEIGLPALVERGLSAIFFPLSARLDRPGSLGGDDLVAIRAAGMDIGSHGMSHRPWRGLDMVSVRAEMVDARAQLVDASRGPIDEAALPLGRYDRAVIAQARKLGYVALHSSDRRLAKRGAWLQPRFSVRRHDSAGSLREQVERSAHLLPAAKLEMVGFLKRLR